MADLCVQQGDGRVSVGGRRARRGRAGARTSRGARLADADVHAVAGERRRQAAQRRPTAQVPQRRARHPRRHRRRQVASPHPFIVVVSSSSSSSQYDELFGKAMRLSNNVLHTLIPSRTSASQRYNLRHRSHSLQLPPHTTCLSDSDFVIRMLYKEIY